MSWATVAVKPEKAERNLQTLRAALEPYVLWILGATVLFVTALIVMAAFKRFALIVKTLFVAAVLLIGGYLLYRELAGFDFKEAIGGIFGVLFILWFLNDLMGPGPRRMRRGRDGHFYED